MSKQRIMEDLDALLADLRVSVRVQQIESQQISARQCNVASVGSTTAQLGFHSARPIDSFVQPASKHLVNVPVSNTATSLSSNLLELDSLLDELDAVQLSPDVTRHSGIDPYNNNVEKVEKFEDRLSSATSRALNSTQELHELMGSLADAKIPAHLSAKMSHFPNSSSHLDSDVSSDDKYGDGNKVSVTQVSSIALKQNTGDLSVLLDALDQNLVEQGIIVQPKGSCAACSKPIVGRVVMAVGKLWHPEHFVCVHCSESLTSCNYFERNLQLYCERDYHLIFSPKCETCTGPILDKCVTAIGRTWHPEHFCCFVCRRQLTENDDFHEKDGLILCRDDYMKRFAPPCVQCMLPILDDHVSAFGHDWHQSCFVCYDCGDCLESGCCYEGSDGKPYCERHIICDGRSPQCAGCGGPILGRCVSAMSRRYHVEHFVCTFCRQPLLRGAFREFEARPYCCACFRRLGGR